jgi:DNA-binding beta-propeller fold protein YncE
LQFNHPCDIASSNDGKLFVVECDGKRAQVFTDSGQFLYTFGQSGPQDGRLQRPWRIAIDNINQLVYITDDDKVKLYDKTGRFVGLFAPGVFTKPRAITIDAQHGEVYVGDYTYNTIVVCNVQGHKLRDINMKDKARIELCGGTAIALDGQGRLVVTGYKENRLCVKDAQTGRLVHTMGSGGDGLGKFKKTRGLAFTKTGQLVVCEWGNTRIQIWG